ncbi:MAG: GC-type dockerin domain-anchored protein [Planctomycetota bacterium]|nr:GC-type dockerin domain-anchored protein [Planctomycetota bacterium]
MSNATKKLLALAAACVGVTAGAGLASAQSIFQVIEPDTGYDYAVVQDVTKNGRYVLVSLQQSQTRPGFPLKGYILDLKNGQRTNISDPGGADLNPLAISEDASVVVGSLGGGPLASTFAFVWTNDTGVTNIGGLSAGNISYATGVSANGSVVVGTTGANFGDQYQQGWRWTESGGFVPLLDLAEDTLIYGSAEDISADGSTVVGFGTVGDQDPDTDDISSAVFWASSGTTPTDMGNLPSPLFTGGAQAMAASSDGSVIVGFGPALSPTNNFANRGFRYTASDGLVSLGSLPSNPEGSLYAFDCSSDGNTVVGYLIDGGVSSWRAVVWTPSTGWRTLNTILAAQGVSIPNNLFLRETYCSGDGKTIAGWAYNLSQNRYKGYISRPCPADFNRDGQVDFFDYLDFASAFASEDASADFNGDSQIDFFDYLDFAAAFSSGC